MVSAWTTAWGCCQRARQGLFRDALKSPPQPAPMNSGTARAIVQYVMFSPPGKILCSLFDFTDAEPVLSGVEGLRANGPGVRHREKPFVLSPEQVEGSKHECGF